MSQYSTKTSISKSFKIILVGYSGSGKTSILIRQVENTFSTTYHPTVGLDYRSKKINQGGEIFNYQLWDTAGQQRFKTIVINYFKLAKAACIVYDLQSEESLLQTEWWIKQINNHCGQITKILIGNKLDLLQQLYSQTELKQRLGLIQQKIDYLCQTYNCISFFGSAKTGKGIKEIFDYLFKQLYRQYINSSPSQRNSIQQNLKLSTIKPTQISLEKPKSCC